MNYLDLKDITAQHADEIRRAVCDVVDSGWYLHGQYTQRFEQLFADYTHHSHCIGVANGLDALTLTLRAYKEMGRLSDGDEVIVPANTFIATVLAITENNLVPVLVEPKYDTLEIDDSRIAQAITPRTRVLMMVHLYGRNAWTPLIEDIIDRHNLIVIEDCAQAHGCPGIGRGDASCYSFYPGKNLGALGDGGAVVTNDDQLAEMVRTIANYGFSERYIAGHTGRNSRLDELQAAVLAVKLQYLDSDNDTRRQYAEQYYSRINNPLVTLPQHTPLNVYHIFPVLCQHRDALQQHLAKHDIGTIIHYPIPPHLQQCYRNLQHGHLPITERIALEELSLPLNQAMTDDDVTKVIDAVNSF